MGKQKERTLLLPDLHIPVRAEQLLPTFLHSENHTTNVVL